MSTDAAERPGRHSIEGGATNREIVREAMARAYGQED